jgi:serine/threonine protein kinase/Tol biopolymer transport system component
MHGTQLIRVRLGAFELDLQSGELSSVPASGSRSRIVLAQQPFRLLVMLVEREGAMVTREEIQKRFWQNDTIVDFDHSINVAIGKLRKALGDSADKPQYIATVASRGYRLLMPVERIAVAEDSPELASQLPESADVATRLATTVQSGQTVSHYRVLDIIGGGGMGVVYRAEDLKLGRRVAIKFLPTEAVADAQTLERFEREAQTASSLNHPNICTIHEFGEHEGQPFLVMELLQGETLRDRLAAAQGGAGLPLEQVLDIALQVSGGLQAAHELGIIHRDIKPANIFLTDKGVCKILDFGLARLLEASEPETEFPGVARFEHKTPIDATLSSIGLAMGTASYMSPEQALGEKLDARTDLFSFGLVLYEMTTGHRAFSGETAEIVRDAIVHQPPVRVRDLNSKIPPRLEAIINAALEKDRGQRCQSAAEMRSDLEMVKGGNPTVARRRWRWAAVLAASAAALGEAILGLSRPLPQPRIIGTVQITNNEDRSNGAPLLTDGARLFFNLAGEPRQMSVKGGQSFPLSLPFPVPTNRNWYKPGDGQLAGISPDRTEFLMYRYEPTDAKSEDLEIWSAPMVGGSPHRLGNILATINFGLSIDAGLPTPHRDGMSDPHMSAIAWSPDGQQLVYPRNRELHLARSDGTEIRKLATFEGDPFFVRWSPDGHRLRLSVSTGHDTQSSMWEVTVDDSRARPLLPGWDPSWYTCCGSWTPDGKYYVFQSKANVWAMRESAGLLQRGGREPVQLTAGLMQWYWPLPSLDGKRLFVVGYEQRNEFLRYDLETGRTATVLSGVSGDNLEFSKDGKWVAYVSVPDGLLFRAAADGSQPLQLSWPPLQASVPHWSPDGKQIAFAGGLAGKPTRIYVVPFDGGEPGQLTSDEGDKDGDGDPSWSPDGVSLAFGATWGTPVAQKSIHVIDLKTKHVSMLPGSEGMWSPHWSPDGRSIAGIYGGREPHMLLKLYDVQTRTQSQLSKLWSQNPSWSWDGEFLFFESDKWVWRLRMRDRYEERVLNLNEIRAAGWGWFAAAPNNSLVTAHDAGAQQIYALDWVAP